MSPFTGTRRDIKMNSKALLPASALHKMYCVASLAFNLSQTLFLDVSILPLRHSVRSLRSERSFPTQPDVSSHFTTSQRHVESALPETRLVDIGSWK